MVNLVMRKLSFMDVNDFELKSPPPTEAILKRKPAQRATSTYACDLLAIGIIHGCHNTQNICVDNHSALHNLFKNSLKYLPAKDQIEFADVREAFIQTLNKHLDQVKNAQLRLLIVDNKNEVQGCVMSINHLYVIQSFEKSRWSDE